MSKNKEASSKIKFDKKSFRDNFIKGEMYHGILINPKEIK
jgi:hypothetical protein